MRPKALCLLSGGLDSTLAARVVLDLGVELEALNFVTAFCTCTPKSAGCAAAVSAARKLGIRVRTLNVTEPFLEVVRYPPHGYGSYLNPCLDCRILMFRRAREYMGEIGASFLVTGEVLGERPMSQRCDAMRLIERESGMNGLVLRPLSARLLPPSIPEKKDWVDREKLLAISGRSRKPQIALARDLGINDYPCPAGGCRLTDPGFAGRMKDLLDRGGGGVITARDATLLRYGRHFRLTPEVKAAVGRNEEENGRISALARPEDVVIEPVGIPGPTTLVVGEAADAELELSCAIAAAHTERGGATIEFEVHSADASRTLLTKALPRERVERLRIRPLSRGWRREVRSAEAKASWRTPDGNGRLAGARAPGRDGSAG